MELANPLPLSMLQKRPKFLGLQELPKQPTTALDEHCAMYLEQLQAVLRQCGRSSCGRLRSMWQVAFSLRGIMILFAIFAFLLFAGQGFANEGRASSSLCIAPHDSHRCLPAKMDDGYLWHLFRHSYPLLALVPM